MPNFRSPLLRQRIAEPYTQEAGQEAADVTMSPLGMVAPLPFGFGRLASTLRAPSSQGPTLTPEMLYHLELLKNTVLRPANAAATGFSRMTQDIPEAVGQIQRLQQFREAARAAQARLPLRQAARQAQTGLRERVQGNMAHRAAQRSAAFTQELP